MSKDSQRGDTIFAKPYHSRSMDFLASYQGLEGAISESNQSFKPIPVHSPATAVVGDRQGVDGDKVTTTTSSTAKHGDRVSEIRQAFTDTPTTSSDSSVSSSCDSGVCVDFKRDFKTLLNRDGGVTRPLVNEVFDCFSDTVEPVAWSPTAMVRAKNLAEVKMDEMDRLSLGSRRSSNGSDYMYRLEHGIPKPPPLPDLERCAVSVVRRCSIESTASSTPSLSSLHSRRRHSHPIHDFTHRIQDKAKKILGKIGLNGDDSHEFLEFRVSKEEVLPIDPVEAEQTRNIIDSFLNEGQVIATTEIEVLEELEQASEMGDVFDGARQEYASLVATAAEAMHEFQDPENIAEILSHDLEECLPTALNPANELFVQHFLAEHGRPESSVTETLAAEGVLPELDSSATVADNLETLPVPLETCQDGSGETTSKPGSKPSSPHIYRFNLDSPYKRLR